MSTLLEVIGIILETHFEFGFPNRSPIEDSLRRRCGGAVVPHLKLPISYEMYD
jgi:hypothetical protein